MTIATAYWCVLIAALLPYLWVFFAKAGAPKYNNRLPRAWLDKQTDNYKVQRANAAHLNAFEAFAPFAAGVVLAQLAGVDHGRTSDDRGVSGPHGAFPQPGDRRRPETERALRQHDDPRTGLGRCLRRGNQVTLTGKSGVSPQ